MKEKQYSTYHLPQQDTFNKYLAQSITTHWPDLALSNYHAEDYRHADVADRIARYHLAWQAAGLKPGFRVALCGRNCAEWCIALFAAFSYGAVAVPLLNEFTPEMVIRLVKHSETQVLIVNQQILKSLEAIEIRKELPELSICLFEQQDRVEELFAERYPKGVTPEDIHYYEQTADELVMINYTSGTTSEPKGVMIPQRAIWSNMVFAQQVLPFLGGSKMQVLSLLPTAHLYGMAFELLYEYIVGIHITFINRALSPKIMLQALSDVKPDLVVVVPMIIEKVVRKGLMPKYNAPLIKVLRQIPGVGRIVKNKFRDGLLSVLGNNLYEVIIGGAGLNGEVEQLLHDIRFPYTVGYGMTECAPIIGYRDWHTFVPTSCGQAAPRMEVRIDSADPQHTPGEILTRGMNVMLGYYKNEEATQRAIDADGWLHTGDMGVVDADGNIFIRGRIKNMLLSPSGQNVYPEEIEAAVNGLPYVVESVVVQREHRLIALVYPDRPLAAKEASLSDDAAILKMLHSHLKDVNLHFPPYAKVNDIELVEQEFEKTPKKSIKRFLYS